MNTLQIGSKGNLVTLLQQFLNCKGWHISIDGSFGPFTNNALKNYQLSIGATEDGIAKQDLITLIQTPTKLDKWCHAIQSREGYIAPCAQYPTGTPAWRNNNPGNIEWHGQRNATSGGRFAHFNTYQDGYNALKTLLIQACTGQISLYNPNGNLYDFYSVYAPSSDGNDSKGYAEEVAKALGVEPDVIIKSLLN